MPNASETLSGSYGTAKLTLPDGSEVPVLARKVLRADGSADWRIVDDKVIAFEGRFSDTDSKPNDLLPPDTEVLDRKVESEETTQRLLYGDLVMFLGDPKRIIAQKGLDPDRAAHMKLHPSSLTLARRLCWVAGGDWARALPYIPVVFPERAP